MAHVQWNAPGAPIDNRKQHTVSLPVGLITVHSHRFTNEIGDQCLDYVDFRGRQGFYWNNIDGSHFRVNPDGSAFYDSGRGLRWFSPMWRTHGLPYVKEFLPAVEPEQPGVYLVVHRSVVSDSIIDRLNLYRNLEERTDLVV